MSEELLNNEIEQNNTKKYGWTFFKPILFKYIIPAVVFIVAFLISIVLSRKYFYIEYLVADDARDYVYFKEAGFGGYIWRSPRPFTNFLMGFGFAVFGHRAPLLMIYTCLFFGVMIATLFVITRKLLNSTIISLFVVILAIFSRLNWYYFATYFGIMENLALTCMILSIYFAVQFVKSDKKILMFLLSSGFYLGSLFFHERYMFCFVPLVILSLIVWKGWKNKALFALIPIVLFGFFLIYRFFIAESTPFVVTGKTKISLDLKVLMGNFWYGFINLFTLFDEKAFWLAGVSNDTLDNFNRELFAITGFIFVAIFVVGILLGFYYFFKKKKEYLCLGIFLGLYCAIMLAAGSVSPSRVEPRWVYSAQIPFLIFIGLSIKMTFDFFGHVDVISDGHIKEKLHIKLFVIAGMAIVLFPYVQLTSHIQDTKEHYYISEDIERTKRYCDQIQKVMKEEGKDKLYAICDKDNYNYLGVTVPQWDEVIDYRIVRSDKLTAESIDFDDTFICICEGNEISRPIIPTLSEPILTNSWVEGNSRSFYVAGTIDELYIRLMKTSFGDAPNNIVSIYNWNNLIVDSYEIKDNTEFFVTLEKDKINRVTLEAKYTYCPADYGGADIRNLSMYILQLGGLGSKPITPKITEPILTNTWVDGKFYSLYVYGVIDELYLQLMKTNFAGMPNNKVTIYNNGKIIYQREIDVDLGLYIPLEKDIINHIIIEADYTYCPAEHGGADIRNLSLFIVQLGGISSELITPSLTEPTLTGYWMDGKSYTIFVMGTIDALYLKLMQTNFDNMPNNKVTIYNGNNLVLDKHEIDSDFEFYIPLNKDKANRITIEADYTYCPAEHGGNDTRNLSLFILQLGGSRAD